MSNTALSTLHPSKTPSFRSNLDLPLRTTPRFVDLLIVTANRELVLIRNKALPQLWSLPGGYAEDYEQLRDAAIREAKEETGLDVSIVRKFGHYSFIDREGICCGISSVFLAGCDDSINNLTAGDDALEAATYPLHQLPELRAEHREIIADYIRVCDRNTPLPFVRAIRPTA